MYLPNSVSGVGNLVPTGLTVCTKCLWDISNALLFPSDLPLLSWVSRLMGEVFSDYMANVKFKLQLKSGILFSRNL